MREDSDRDLREAFAAVGESDRGETPPFEAMWRAASSRAGVAGGNRLARAFTAGLAAACLLIVGVVTRRGASPEVDPATLEMARAISSWRAPTDDLPDTSVFNLLEEDLSLEFRSVALPSLPMGDVDTRSVR